MSKRSHAWPWATIAVSLAGLVGCSNDDAPAKPVMNAGESPGQQDEGSEDATSTPDDGTDRPSSKPDGGVKRPLDGGATSSPDAGNAGPGSDDKTPTASCTDLMTATASGTKTPYPGGRWTVPAPTFGTFNQNDVQIEMSDGVVLVGDVSYPAELGTEKRAVGKFPVILTQNPYGAVYGPDAGALFVTHGYIFASIDVRGTSRSEGVHDMFAPREAEDGAALVAWAAKLDGADGAVGLQGCSQLGINQLETATMLGPNSPVKAMIPACGSGDFYRDTAFDNGIPTIVGSATAGDDAASGGDKAYYREYWKTRDRLARAPAIARADIPALLWAGWNEPGALGSLELYRALQNLAAGRPADAPIQAGEAVSAKYQVILGDWSHAMGLDQGIELQWFDTWIKGVDTGLPTGTGTPLHLSERGGTKRWVNARCYPIIEGYTPLYLGSKGRLVRETNVSSKEQDALKWVPPGEQSAAIEYTTEPFAEGVMVAGPLAAHLEVTSSNRNLQLVVDVLDKAPDGKLAPVSHGSILGSLRRTDKGKTWRGDNGLPTRPFLTLDEDLPLTPGELTPLDVPLWPTVWSFEPGHRIVLRISTQPANADCQNLLGVPVGCYPTNPMKDSLAGGTYTVHHSGSLLNLPLLDHGSLPTSESVVSPTGKVEDGLGKLLGLTEYPLPIDW